MTETQQVRTKQLIKSFLQVQLSDKEYVHSQNIVLK